jgi:hypothetical protein
MQQGFDQFVLRPLKIELDDWTSAVALLPPAAEDAAREHGLRVEQMFFGEPVVPYSPVRKLPS